MKTYKNCQSCLMPFKRDPKGGGTEADGSKSTLYCSTCYTDGKFNNPEIDTAQKMQVFVKDKMKSLGFPGIFASFMVKKIPSLVRWKS